VILVRGEMSEEADRCGAVDLLMQLLQQHVEEGTPTDVITAMYMELVPYVVRAVTEVSLHARVYMLAFLSTYTCMHLRTSILSQNVDQILAQILSCKIWLVGAMIG
jgi:hypothetical protein